ncbi:hypothetical protein LR48_Vigan181s003800 [Vigna angularis]|uniref:Uncharacterized protein n=1 Tax=Phaseolus angularis TaxID=3914 RepID=A0A0L9T575_PHAAN|nr:hypothetical protein LR48_Vigan181s003800 [Vigna angularis]
MLFGELSAPIMRAWRVYERRRYRRERGEDERPEQGGNRTVADERAELEMTRGEDERPQRGEAERAGQQVVRTSALGEQSEDVRLEQTGQRRERTSVMNEQCMDERPEQVEATRGEDERPKLFIRKNNTFGEMMPTKPLANQRGRNNAPKRRRNNGASGKTRALEKWRTESTSMAERERERETTSSKDTGGPKRRTNNGGQRHHFNDEESFKGRNFNDGDRVLKDLSVKGERKFRKGGERVSKRGKESFEKKERDFRRVSEKRQKVSENYSKNALQNKMNL